MKYLLFFALIMSLKAETFTPIPSNNELSSYEKVAIPFDNIALKKNWKTRIEAIKNAGIIPLIDVESSFNPKDFNLINYAKTMDDEGIAMIAFSAQIGEKAYEKESKLWHDSPRNLMSADPSRYVPTSTAGTYPAWTKEPENFIKESIKEATLQHYLLLGEFEFRHYLSPRQYKRNEYYRDVNIPIDSPASHFLFKFANESGIPFQIHYEIEDELFEPLEKMLQLYPKAKVIWCHLAQIRYSEKAKNYDPKLVRGLIERHPNLYFDLAFGDKDSIYKPSNEFQSRIWDRNTGKLKPEWAKLIEDYPYHFLTAFDIGGDREDELKNKAISSREVLKSLSSKTQEIVAYKAFWKLVFNEDY